MREDPLVFNDWEVGHPINKFVKPVLTIDASLSLLINLIFIVLGVVAQSAVAIFSFITVLFVLLFIELALDQHTRNINNRILTIFAFFGAIYLFGLNLIGGVSIFIVLIISSLLLLKIGFIPLVISTLLITGDILIPKSEYARLKLEQHLNILSVTEYAINQNKLNRERKELSKELIVPYLVGVVIISIIAVILNNLDELGQLIVLAILKLFLLASGLSIFALLMVWRFVNTGRIPLIGRFLRSKQIDQPPVNPELPLK